VFQLLVVVYFVASLAVRFVFPNFSLEAENAWNLLSSPVSRTKLFWTKAVFFGGLLGILTLCVSVIHLFILGISVTSGLIFLVMAVTAAVTVALIGLALGARFPNFETSDPQKPSTTLPGLSFVIVSMLYGGLASYTLYLTFLTGQLLIAGLFVLGSALLAYGFCMLATAKLDAIEFTPIVRS
jgi:ABC-2 type transport system permease protein